MVRGPCTFKERDVTRALRAVVRAGIEVQRVEVDKDGRIIIVIAKTSSPTGDNGATEWDRFLK